MFCVKIIPENSTFFIFTPYIQQKNKTFSKFSLNEFLEFVTKFEKDLGLYEGS